MEKVLFPLTSMVIGLPQEGYGSLCVVPDPKRVTVGERVGYNPLFINGLQRFSTLSWGDSSLCKPLILLHFHSFRGVKGYLQGLPLLSSTWIV
jgi:hypothetical protein